MQSQPNKKHKEYTFMTLSHTATGVFHEINTYTSSGQTARIRLFYKHTPTSYI